MVRGGAGVTGAGAVGRAGATAGGGTTSLGLAVAVAASQAGSWCAAVGWPSLGMVAAAGLGMVLERFALIPHPGEQWQAVIAALIDAVDVILVTPPGVVRASDARRLTARVRERGVVLIVRGAKGGWPEAADILLSVAPTEWRGLGQGHGYLQARSVEVTSYGRGAASRERRVQLWLPGSNGTLGALNDGKQTSAGDQEAATAASAAG